MIGGTNSLENLVAVPVSAVMPEYVRLFEQIRDLPDGISVVIKDWLASTRTFRQ